MLKMMFMSPVPIEVLYRWNSATSKNRAMRYFKDEMNGNYVQINMRKIWEVEQDENLFYVSLTKEKLWKIQERYRDAWVRGVFMSYAKPAWETRATAHAEQKSRQAKRNECAEIKTKHDKETRRMLNERENEMQNGRASAHVEIHKTQSER